MIEALCHRLKISDTVAAAGAAAYAKSVQFTYEAQHCNRFRVLEAFMEEGLAESDLAGSTGYGYDDSARDCYERLLARLFGAEAALARLSLVSGTHAIVSALAACVPPGKVLLSVTGRPYDTLRNAIAQAPFSLCEMGMQYRELPLQDGQRIDLQAIAASIQDPDVAAIFIQRSRGYAPRHSISVSACARAVQCVRDVRPDVLILVDNCYGELVETQEPTHVGADLIMGSLIKNIGGSIAPAGGYIAGRADLLEAVSARLFAPGLGRALGPTLGLGRSFLQGLFLAPLVVEQVLRGLDFSAELFASLGFGVDPLPGTQRTDIVQAIRLQTPDRVLAFATGLQKAMPVNGRFRPEPGPVPGYRDPVIMSSGAFIAGATIELSCDAPLREPYEVYLQGGVMAEHAMIGSLLAADAVLAAT
ncbi:MAG: methionine gamma-lyase family protein [Candidatus Eremiobacteraeota bacterium]|nr:methionine gamma-lyase family protein [Candidatus Eremiobacteraeota bacterium]